MVSSNPAEKLEGLSLKNGWNVISHIDRDLDDTGGHFSFGYVVKNDNGIDGYLKAMNFAKATQSSNQTKAIEAMFSAYNFEKDLLEKCVTYKLSNIVKAIDSGDVLVPCDSLYHNTVYYLIFEKADGDIRKLHRTLRCIDNTWCLGSLHNIALGIHQLHLNKIAHQDLKPSNVLVFNHSESKVSDLGRASDANKPFDYDSLIIPGDIGYAPPELGYDYLLIDSFARRFAVDMYLFGSLFYFYFADISAKQALLHKLGNGFRRSSFESDLPVLRHAFNSTLSDLHRNVSRHMPGLAEEIVNMVKELCEPDPSRRGHPRDIAMKHGMKYSLERYISKLANLQRKARWI